MKAILGGLHRNPHAGLVRLWHGLRHDHPAFMAAEKVSRERPEEHAEVKRMWGDSLRNARPVRAFDLGCEFPLAALQALDEYLYEYFDSCAPGPSPMYRVGKADPPHFLHRRPRVRPVPGAHSRQTGHVQAWLRHHWVIPAKISGIAIRRRSLDTATGERLVACADGLKVYVGSFADGVAPAWIDPDAPGFLAEALTDREARWNSIRSSLEEASAAGAQLLVLPELSVCPALRSRVSCWLDEHPEHPLLLVLPGSFHQQIGGACHNYAELFDLLGAPILFHRKLTTFGVLEGAGAERIEPGGVVELLDTPLGLVAMPICLDFCEEGSPFNRLWEELGAEWVLVPAFGDARSVSAHQRRAASLSRAHGTVSVVANQDPAAAGEAPGFAQVAPGAQPQAAGPGGRVACIPPLTRLK